MRSTATILVLTVLFSAAATQQALGQETVTLEPDRDNTLFESATGSLSNGAGEHIFVGVTGPNAGNNVRRALIRFDVADAVPSGSTIESVTFTVNLSRIAPGAGTPTVNLHRVSRDWGEGTSNASGVEGEGAASTEGDATWIHAFFNDTPWGVEGGDFSENVSASTVASGTGPQTWESTSNMVADVQHWLDNPDENFGWILIGNESTNHTALRFDSRENSNNPELVIQYRTATSSEELPTTAGFALHGAFPNPFTESTTLEYSLDTTAPVRFEVYDVLGRRVRTLEASVQPAGDHTLTLESGSLTAGVYLIRMEAGQEVRFRQVVLSR